MRTLEGLMAQQKSAQKRVRGSVGMTIEYIAETKIE